MKTCFSVLVAFLSFFGGAGLLLGAPGLANLPAPGQIKVLPAPAPYAVTKRDANSRVWERTAYQQLPSGQIISRQYHYTELASGMHYQDAQGQWTESKEQIETYATGAIARQGQYQVIFANNLNTAGSIDMQTPDGKRLRSNILGLSYYDSSTGQSVLIAQIQDSQGELISSNQVLYLNVFAGVKADVRYTYKKGSFEQDVILREQPPTPESLALNSQYTVIEVMTEFINPPAETINDFSGSNKIQADQDISWGAMRIGHGKAFDLDETLNQRSVVQVMKQYVSVNGRQVLLEKVPLPNISASLSKLPRQASIPSTLPMTASTGPQLPKAPLALAQQRPMKLAVTTPSNKGYVLDYVVLNTDQNNFTFQGDTTYYVTAGFNLTGTTTFEGGTVVKCDPGCQINLDAYGSIKCQTTAYRPAVFTSVNDDSIGDPGYWTSDPYYTGSPSCGDVDTFLNVNCSSPVLGNMRFCYASQAIQASSSAGAIDLWDCQFMNASNCLIATAADVNLHNVLMSVVGGDYPIYIASSGNLTAENVTSDGCGSGNGLVHVDYPGTQTVILTNTLVTSGQNVSVNGGAFALSSNPIYQTVGGGSYYLTNNSPYRNAGTTNISADLLGELRQKTTSPPLLPYVNTTIASATSLSPQAQRDTDTPDLGYHYDPLDYVIIGSDLTTNLTITAGTAVGFYDNYGYGLRLDDGANLTMTGTASAPCWITSYNTVQECGNGNWPISLGQGVIVFNGSGAAPIPQASATFTKWPAMPAGDAHIHGPGNFGVGTFVDCEFYGDVIASYRPSYYFTNCLFARVYTAYWDQSDAASFTYQNCTFYDGFIAMCRYVGQSPSFWTIKNTMFDGTGLLHDDNFNASTNHTYFDYNAYNTNNNSSWVTYPSGYWSDPTLETIGAHDVFITNLFAWQNSWLGDFCQPTNSPLIDAGSPTADLVGLYHFTTQTNQVKETNSTVDIGYHYVAVDTNGSPIDTYWFGIPDYLADNHGELGVWEMKYFGYLGVDPNNDSDLDGLSNLQEYQLGSNPLSTTMVLAWGDNTFGECNVPLDLTNAVAVAGNGDGDPPINTAYSLALKADGSLVAWGDNTFGQTNVSAALSNVMTISAGTCHGLALRTNGSVASWGHWKFYQPNTNGDYVFPEAVVPANFSNIVAIAAGRNHDLAVRSDGAVLSWGYDTNAAWVKVPTNLPPAKAVGAGWYYSAALLTNGTVAVWAGSWNTPTNLITWNIPTNLTNVIAISGGPFDILALKADGAVVDLTAGSYWDYPGASNSVAIANGYQPGLALKSEGLALILSNSIAAPVYPLEHIKAIGAGWKHALAVRGGLLTPIILTQPASQAVLPGANVTFNVQAIGLAGMTCQWQFNDVNISGAANTSFSLTGVTTNMAGAYKTMVKNNAGSVLSSNAVLTVYDVTPPVIVSVSLPTNPVVNYSSNLTLSVVATAHGQSAGFPLSYQWRTNGVSIAGATSSNYTFAVLGSWTYSVVITNALGSTNASWLATAFYPGGVLIPHQPTNQYQIAGGNATFIGSGVGSNAVTFQWTFNGTNIAGATHASLTLTNVSATNEGLYNYILSDGAHNLTSSNVSFTLVKPPTIASQTPPTNLICIYGNYLSFAATATAPGQTNGFPLHYQWQFNGTNIPYANTASYSFAATNDSSGIYSVIVTNLAGSTNASWLVNALPPGSIVGWGDDSDGECDAPFGLTNVAVIAAGEYHSVAIADSGAVLQWGYNWDNVPADLTNAVAVAAGYEHSIALRSDGTVETWGSTNAYANYAPAGLSNVTAVACGWDHNVALLTNGTVMAWGFGGESFGWDLTNVPSGLANVTAISAEALHSLALKSDGTVAAWGDDSEGETDVPAGLSNVVAVAAGGQHSLALKVDGTVVAWGYNGSGQCNVPAGLSNVMAIAAGWAHSSALKNDGTVVSWGDNSDGQTNVIGGLNNVKLIAAGGDFTLAAAFSPLVQYPVDVAKDLLLIYNSNSSDSSNVCAYYLAHRPMVGGANVLSVACTNGEFFFNTNDWDTQLVNPVLNWLTNNPTKRPQYVILFYDIPMRLWLPGDYGCGGVISYSGSVSYHLLQSYPTWHPFVNNINQGTLADCEAYVDKVASFATNSPGKLMISASAGNYGNTNYYFDDSRDLNYAGPPSLGNDGVIGVTGSDSLASVTYTNGNDFFTNRTIHLLGGSNVSGYLCWGEHSALGQTYAVDGTIKWTGNSGWWIIETIESFNGMRNPCAQGNFIQWYSSNAFGGTNYSNTPIGAVSHTEEPGGAGNCENGSVYFGLWAGGKNFAISAWNSRRTPYFQAVGDPFVVK